MANCGCPPGSTLNQDGLCVGIVLTAPIINTTTYVASAANNSPCYWGVTGATFYPDISLLPYPLQSSNGNVGGACLSPSGIRTTLTDALNNVLPVLTSVINNVWGWVYDAGRLATIGVWTLSDPINEWIGFTFCETLLTTKTYHIGIAGDDVYQLYIDGVLVVNHSTGFGFVDWKIFPITLTAGIHIFETRVKNSLLGSPAGLGFEIYDATSIQLQAVVTANNTPGPTDLNQYIIFSTLTKINKIWETGEVSGYTCPDGTSLSTCQGFMCASIGIIAPLPCCFLLTPCDTSTGSIIVNNDLSLFVDTVIQVCPSNIPSQGGSGSGSGVSVKDTGINNSNWKLTDCCGILASMTVNNLLDAYDGGTIVVPSVNLTTCWRVEKGITSGPFTTLDLTGSTYYVNCTECNNEFSCQSTPLLTECTCFTVTKSTACSGAITLINENIIVNFSNCDLCAPTCFYLVDCTNANNYIITDDQDLLLHLGKIVKLADCPNTCWQVLLSDDCDNTVCITTIIEVFDTCIDCLPPVPVIPPVALNPRVVKPGYYTPGCSPAYTEKVNCSFAKQMYNIMLIKRYGLKICCEEDQIEWQIKKQLLDFKAIYDPDLCKCFLTSCCPPACVIVELNVFNPTSPCPVPTSVISTFDFTPIPCLVPDTVISLLEWPVLLPIDLCPSPIDVVSNIT